MTSATGLTSVVIFESRDAADRGIVELLKSGFLAEQVGLVQRPPTQPPRDGSAVVGEAAGIGLLAGMSIGAVAAGTLAGLFGGGLAGGLLGILAGRGIPVEEARYYQRQLDEGKVLVTVESDGRAAEALAILGRHGGHEAEPPQSPPASACCRRFRGARHPS